MSTYRIRIETVEAEEGDAAINVDKIITEEVTRIVIVSMIQAENHAGYLLEYARQREEAHQRRLDAVTQRT